MLDEDTNLTTLNKYYKRDINITQDDLLFNTLENWNEKLEDNEIVNVPLDEDESFDNCYMEKYDNYYAEKYKLTMEYCHLFDIGAVKI